MEGKKYFDKIISQINKPYRFIALIHMQCYDSIY